jgi:hypothetical protein
MEIKFRQGTDVAYVSIHNEDLSSAVIIARNILLQNTQNNFKISISVKIDIV